LFVRPLFLAAVLATVSFAVLTAPAAQAFTFQDQDANGGAKNSDSSMFYNDGKPGSAPLSSRLDSSGQTTAIKRGNSTIYFGGGGQTFDQRNDPGNYFNPNVLMGK
jgi:hypothetical protein